MTDNVSDLERARLEKEKAKAKRMAEERFAKAHNDNQLIALCASFMIEFAKLRGTVIDMTGTNQFGTFRVVVNFKHGHFPKKEGA